jgi:hypothetical protein
MMNKLLSLVVAGLFLFNPIAVFAAPDTKADTQLDLGALGPSVPKIVGKRMVETTYTQVSYSNLYKLAWSYDAYSSSNEDALNTYLMITECNLYNKFFVNEFEWEKIKNATKEYIRINKDNVPRYYEYIQPIYMGRYDYSLQGFPIVDAKEFKAQKNFQFASFGSGDTSCGHYNLNPIIYPSTAVISISSPLNLSFIRVPIQLAQKYVEWRSKQGIFEDTKRQAFVRYRIRIDGYQGVKSYSAGVNAFNFNGKLMRLDVFADKELLLPLYNQVF